MTQAVSVRVALNGVDPAHHLGRVSDSTVVIGVIRFERQHPLPV
jgi:hypothetical protein